MEKLQLNTKKKIYLAFKEVLGKKTYNEIRIQDILDESKIARSTFYSHFKTKEEVLCSISEEIFTHVFSHSLEEEKTHDFSKTSLQDYQHFFTHIFYHLHDERDLIRAIYSSEGKDIFLNYFRGEFRQFAKLCVESNFIQYKNLPFDLRVNAVVESLVLVINYWVRTDFKDLPETLTEYYFTLVK